MENIEENKEILLRELGLQNVHANKVQFSNISNVYFHYRRLNMLERCTPHASSTHVKHMYQACSMTTSDMLQACRTGIVIVSHACYTHVTYIYHA